MKKFLLTIVAAALMAPLWAATVPHRLVYGYFMTNKSTADYGLGRFYMDDPQNIEIIAPGDGAEGWFAGAVADGIYYACTYRYDITEGPVPSSFISYDLSTGERRVIGNWSEDSYNTYLKFQDMTYDYSTKTMYAVGFELGKNSLYSFDLATGQPTLVTPLSVTGFGSIACSYDGRLYGFNTNDASLYLINKTSGQCVKLVTLGDEYLFSYFEQSMEFDHTTGLIYLADRSSKLDSRKDFLYLVRIDVSQSPVAFEDVAQVGDDAALQALYIPYVLDGEAAPAAPSDLVVKSADGGVAAATLTWSVPAQTFGGDPLTDLQSIVVERDGEVVATLAASAQTYTDENVPTGQHRYVVYGVNTAGKGETAFRFAYIGRDWPDEPQNISVKVGEGCQSAIISWDEPVRGYHNGYFTTEGLTYSIRRYPDLMLVAEGLTERTFTDQSLRRLGAYSYEVIASNAFGQAGQYTPKTYVLGAPISLTEGDFVESFDNHTRFLNQWTEVDANGDYYSWVYNTMAPQYVLGNNDPGAVYFLNPGIYNAGIDADEWLLSPPLRLEAGKHYKVVLHLRSLLTEKLSVTFGKTNEVEEQQVLNDLTIAASIFQNGVALYSDYEIGLPQQDVETIGCVGLHLTTPYAGTDNYSMFHINTITVKEGQVNAISDVRLGASDVRHTVFDLQGRRVAAPRAKGLYVVDGKKYIAK